MSTRAWTPAQGDNAEWIDGCMHLAFRVDLEIHSTSKINPCRTGAESSEASNGALDGRLEQTPPSRVCQPKEPQKRGTNDSTPAHSLGDQRLPAETSH
jgi:hypothetical protein